MRLGVRQDLDKIIKQVPISEEDRLMLQQVMKEYWQQKRKGRL